MSKINLELVLDKNEFKQKLDIKDGAKGQKGDKGKDADETVIVQDVIKSLTPLIPKEETVDTIVEKLNSVEEIIEPTSIIGFEKTINDLKSTNKTVHVGGGGGGIQLQINNIKKGLARFVNLIAGTNITITDNLVNGLHEITIDASGGGSAITSINTDTTAAQTLTVGTTGTDFAIVDNGTGDHKFNLPTASHTNRGALSSTDWDTFNGKVATTRAINTTAPLAGGGDLSADRTLTTSMSTNKLIGRGTAGTGVMEEITLGTNLSLTGTTINASGGGMAIGSAVTSGTSGSILYVDGSSDLAQDNADLFWDAINKFLGVGTASPAHTLHIIGDFFVQPTNLGIPAFTLYDATNSTNGVRFSLQTAATGSTLNDGFSVIQTSVGSKGTIVTNYESGPIDFFTGAAGVGGGPSSNLSVGGTGGVGVNGMAGNSAIGLDVLGDLFYGILIRQSSNQGNFINLGATSTTAYIGFNNTIGTSGLGIDVNGNILIPGKVTQYNSASTTGYGVPAIYGSDRKTGLTAAQVLATYTVGASDGSFEVSANVLVTTATLHNFTCTVSYTSEDNVSRVLTLQFSTLAGAFLTNIINTAGTVPYEGVPLHIRCKASTTIIIATTGTFTTCAYNFEECIKQLA